MGLPPGPKPSTSRKFLLTSLCTRPRFRLMLKKLRMISLLENSLTLERLLLMPSCSLLDPLSPSTELKLPSPSLRMLDFSSLDFWMNLLKETSLPKLRPVTTVPSLSKLTSPRLLRMPKTRISLELLLRSKLLLLLLPVSLPLAKLSETIAEMALLHKAKIEADVKQIEADWTTGNFFTAGKDAADALAIVLGPVHPSAFLQ